MSEDIERDTIPTKDVAAAFKAIEVAYGVVRDEADHGWEAGGSYPKSCIICRLGAIIAEQRRKLGIEVKE